MKKLFTFIVAFICVASTIWAQNGIKLTFQRTDNTEITNKGTTDEPSYVPNNLTINVTDLEGNSLSGVTVTLTKVNFDTFKSTYSKSDNNNPGGDAITDGKLLAPNSYGNAKGSTIEFTFKIKALSSIVSHLDQVALGVSGINGSGQYQANVDTRPFNFIVNYGTDENVSNSLPTAKGDIHNGCNNNNENYQTITVDADQCVLTNNDSIYVKITLQHNAEKGCYVGLRDVELINNNVIYRNYSPNGDSFSREIPIDWTTQKVFAKIQLEATNSNSHTGNNDNLLSIGSNISNWAGNPNLHFYYYYKTGKLQYDYVNSNGRSIANKRDNNRISGLADNIITVEFSKTDGLKINGIKEEGNATTLAGLTNLNSIQIGSAEGQGRCYQTIKEVSIVSSDYTPNDMVSVTWNVKENANSTSNINSFTIMYDKAEDNIYSYSNDYEYVFTSINGTTTLSTEATSGTQDIIATFDAPFGATSIDDAKWYQIKNSDNKYMLIFDGTKVNKISAQESMISNTPSIGNWAFIGNPISGVSIYNQYSKQYISVNDSREVILSEEPKTWQVGTGTETSDTTLFTLYYTQGNNTYYWNYGSITDSNDSTTYNTVTLNTSSSDWIANTVSSYYTYLNTQNTKLTNLTFGEDINEYNKNITLENGTTTTNEELSEQFSNIDNNINDGSNQAEVDNLAEQIAYVLSASNAIKINEPQTGTFIRIKGYNSDYYLAASSSTTTGTGRVLSLSDSKTDNTIWYYDSDNKSLRSYTEGIYIDAKNNGSDTQPITSSTPSAATFSTNIPILSQTYTISTNDYYLYHRTPSDIKAVDHGSNINSNEGYAWILEYVDELPITLKSVDSTNYYSTLYLPKAYTLDNATAYIAGTPNANDTEITLTSIDNVTAGTPIVIKGSSNSVTVKLTNPKETETENPVSNNALKGIGIASLMASSTTDNETTYTNYYFGAKDNNVGFYKPGSTAQKTYITNKAYLPLSTSSNSRGFTFAFGNDDDPTGINNATEKNVGSFDADAPRYDLKGVRVGKDYKGIVIINGKKYLIM